MLYTSPYVVCSHWARLGWQCELVRSGFKEDLSVFLSTGGARALGVDYSAVPVPMPRPCDADKVA
jgi:hypothetical protein